jgi:NADH-quinone oxidoreductase subunit C
MLAADIIEIIKQHAPDALVAAVAEGPHPYVQVKAERITAVADFLRTDGRLRFDLLRCISAVDWPARNNIEVSYDLLSTMLGHAFAFKVMLDRANPQVETLSGVWPAAEWHEREAYDLMGVTFTGHPDLRRILMPEDWTGHPLRKDYQDLVEYQGLKIHP